MGVQPLSVDSDPDHVFEVVFLSGHKCLMQAEYQALPEDPVKRIFLPSGLRKKLGEVSSCACILFEGILWDCVLFQREQTEN